MTERSDGEIRSFELPDGVRLCRFGVLDPPGRLALWCPAPPGVADEMTASEPTRFLRVHPPVVDGRWQWLATFLDGTGDETVDWEEVAAILTDAFAVVGAARSVGEPHPDPAPGREGSFTFVAPLWVYPSGNWHFLTVPTDVGAALAEAGALLRRGFGSLRVDVTIDRSAWSTSVFPDRDSGSFLLPIKKAVRTANALEVGDVAVVTLSLSDA